MSEKENIVIDDARALVSDQALWPLVRSFLWDFAPQVHRSWIEGLGLDKLECLEQLESNPRVKKHVLSSLGVSPCFHAFPKDDWSRLLLLDGTTLESIVKWLGALACADELRRVTAGATVRELKSSLPGIYPEVFGYMMYFKGIDFQRKGDDANGCGVQDVISAGVSILVSLLDSLPASLVSRLKFKLPKDLCASASLRLKQETCVKVLAKLLKLKFPEAYKLCC